MMEYILNLIKYGGNKLLLHATYELVRQMLIKFRFD